MYKQYGHSRPWAPRVSVNYLVEPLIPRFETRAYTTIVLSAAAVSGEIDYQRTTLPLMIKDSGLESRLRSCASCGRSREELLQHLVIASAFGIPSIRVSGD